MKEHALAPVIVLVKGDVRVVVNLKYEQWVMGKLNSNMHLPIALNTNTLLWQTI